MIATLRGRLLFSDSTSVVVECGGVGFKCTVTRNTLNNLPKEGDEIFLYTHMQVREDAMDLYGFNSSRELEAFRMITSVNGVGAKIGVAILSELSAGELNMAIAANDPKTLTRASGVGIKLAQRIVLELKDKVGTLEGGEALSLGSISRAVEGSNSAEAVEALIALGFAKGEASLAVGKLDGSLSSSELIKEALKSLSRR